MNEKFYNCVLASIENCKQAIFYYDKTERNPFLASQKAIELFADQEGKIDVYQIFDGNEASHFLKSTIVKKLQEDSATMVYDVPITDNKGQCKIADVQVGYADSEKASLFVEIFFKEDTRMEQAISNINQSPRAEGIFNLDERLTLIHCNELFYQVFQSNENNAVTHYNNELANGFQEEHREETLKEIKENLEISPVYLTKIKVITTTMEAHWYSMEIQKRTLDDSGLDKIMVSLMNIEKQMEVENQLVNINQYFNIIQKETVCTLFRYDIKKRILYRNEEMAKEYGIPPFLEDYPNEEQVNRAVHPDYRTGYLEFFQKVVAGEDGVYNALLHTVSDTYEYHSVNARAVRNPDGTIHEMLITVKNNNELKEAENELSGVNKHFNAFQSLSDELLFHIDLKTKMLTRHGNKVELFGLTEESVLFPDAVYESGSILPEDKFIYEEFAQQVFQGEEGTVELRMQEHENEDFQYQRISWTTIDNEDGVATEIIGKLTNIQAVKDLEIQANYDALTRALNKRAVAESTTQLINRSKEGEKHALLFLDLDDFKYVNDHLGHSFGDLLLKKLGARIRECVRYHDLVGRVGGDEFVVILRGIATTDILMGKAKMILSAISEDVVEDEKRHSIKGSIGIAVYPDHGATYEELYNRADLALYRSKHKGKNLVTIYTNDMADNN